MLTEEQVKALKLKGLTYWQCDGKDYAFDIKTVLAKKEKFLEQGIQIVRGMHNIIVLVPASWYKTDTVEICNTIPLFIDTQTFTIVGCRYFLQSLFPKFITLDFSNVYIRPTDLKVIRKLANISQHVILSHTLDKPSIISLDGLFSYTRAKDIDFTDFSGRYIKRVNDMFERSEVQRITWDYADFSDVESAVSMFYCAEIRSVNLSTFPMLPSEGTIDMFLGSNLPEQYTEDSLASGELQAWCKKHFQKY